MGTYDYLIFGSGGFGREVAWLVQESLGPNAVIAFLVDGDVEATAEINGHRVLNVDSIELRENSPVVVAIGSPASRREIANRLFHRGARFGSVIDRGARMSSTVEFGEGSVVCAGTVATVNIKTGSHVHINLNCTVGHDVRIGDFVTLSPGVHVSGNVVIEDDVFIGTGACIINGKPGKPLRIGSGATIGAGAVVIRDVPCNALVTGVPATEKVRSA